MKKLTLLIAGLLVFALTRAQKTQTPKPPHTPHILLWRISGKNITHPSYLFGTMHILCAKDAVLSDSLKAAIKKCDEIYFEINLSDMAGMLNSMKYMRMNDSKKLSDLLK
ncbi:MAG TPA: TraB/GumN family protein, partial [Puia sp.]|nr:TraB/GumN family protein [Puia sp.]